MTTAIRPLKFSSPVPLTRLLNREVSKPLAVSVDGAQIRRLAENVLVQYVELNRLREAITATASEFEYHQPEPYRSTVVTVRFRPGEVVAPPEYDLD
jgi:hypothetical protein